MHDKLVKVLRQLSIVCRASFVLSSGEKSEFYVDVKKAYGHHGALTLISDELYKTIDENTTCIAAAGYGGLSPASVISSKYGLNLSLVRDRPKKHGLCKLIDGYLPEKTDRVAIIDDVFTTGGSLGKIIKALEPTGAEILGCSVVVKRGGGQSNAPLSYLITLEELL
ncbi:MAG: hypothetical protein HY363_05425 [Candidatus Aenigmarchaeota archaeon]|nr:hypothetical protein [Candidatus Aenigmarchaeota archaeon]